MDLSRHALQTNGKLPFKLGLLVEIQKYPNN